MNDISILDEEIKMAAGPKVIPSMDKDPPGLMFFGRECVPRRKTLTDVLCSSTIISCLSWFTKRRLGGWVNHHLLC